MTYVIQTARHNAEIAQASCDAGLKEKDALLRQLQGECEMLGKQVRSCDR